MHKKDIFNIGLALTMWVAIIKWFHFKFKKRKTLHFYSQRNITDKPKLFATLENAKASIGSNKIKFNSKSESKGFIYGQVLRLEKSATEENYFIAPSPGLYQKVSPNGFFNLG